MKGKLQSNTILDMKWLKKKTLNVRKEINENIKESIKEKLNFNCNSPS